MSSLPRLRVAVVLSALGCLLVGSSRAQMMEQSPRQPGRSDMPMRRAAQNQNQEVDQFLASALLAKNRNFVELSQLAEQKAHNPQVKQFAQRMVQDHQKLSQKLEQVAGTQPGETGYTGRTGQRHSVGYGSQPDQQQPEQQDPMMGGQQGGGMMGGQQGGGMMRDQQGGMMGGQQGETMRQRMENHMENMRSRMTRGQTGALNEIRQIDQEIANKTGTAVRDQLNQKTGTDFDEAYLACVIGAHVQLKAATQVLEGRATGQLREIAQQAEPELSQHLQEAQQLLTTVEKGQSNH